MTRRAATGQACPSLARVIMTGSHDTCFQLRGPVHCVPDLAVFGEAGWGAISITQSLPASFCTGTGSPCTGTGSRGFTWAEIPPGTILPRARRGRWRGYCCPLTSSDSIASFASNRAASSHQRHLTQPADTPRQVPKPFVSANHTYNRSFRQVTLSPTSLCMRHSFPASLHQVSQRMCGAH